jgi:hypothetical protein
MEEPYTEGLATRGGPESCADVREGVGEALTGGSSRQGCEPAGESPAMTIAHVGHVATPHPGPGNRPGDAWFERPGRPVARWCCCGGSSLEV